MDDFKTICIYEKLPTPRIYLKEAGIFVSFVS